MEVGTSRCGGERDQCGQWDSSPASQASRVAQLPGPQAEAAAHGQERGGFLERGVCHGLKKLTGCDLDEALLRPPLRRDPFATVGAGWILNVSRKAICPFGGVLRQ